MKLLFLSWRDIENPKSGGAEVFTHEVLKRLAKKGHEIDHISPLFEHASREEYLDGVRYLRYGNAFSVIKFAMNWAQEHQGQYDLVVDQCNTHQFFTPLWLPKNQPRALFIHQLTREIWWHNTRFPLNLAGYIAESSLLRLHRKSSVLTVSNSTKTDLLNLGFDDSKIHMLPEGINFKTWSKSQFKEKEEKFTALYVGRFAKYKGIEDAIKGFAHFHRKNPNSELWLIGRASHKYQQNLQSLINHCNIEHAVTFFGFVSEKRKLELMSRAHCLLYPSTREGWGLTVTESNAVGTIAIAYNAPGLRDAVQHEHTGLLCEDNTPEQLAYQMQILHQSPELAQIMRQNAHKWSKTFSWNTTAQVAEQALQDIIAHSVKQVEVISRAHPERIPTLIVGETAEVDLILQKLQNSHQQYHPVGIVNLSGKGMHSQSELPVLGKLFHLEKLIKEHSVKHIVQSNFFEHNFNLMHLSQQHQASYEMIEEARIPNLQAA